MNAILVLNAGSSSIKFAAFERGGDPGQAALLLRGRVAQAANGTELVARGAHGEELARSFTASPDPFDPRAALDAAVDWIGSRFSPTQLGAIGHRVVHGGTRYSAPARLTPQVLGDLHALEPLAPLHQPYNLLAIEMAAARWPQLPQVACFDTAFHSTQPAVAQAFALPRAITEGGVRRYGFHGLSYEYVASRLSTVLGLAGRGKVIIAHLGSGASLCALADGRSVASTMGFSALDGLPMGTRCGALDPGVVLYLLQHLKMDAAEVSDLLYKRSGLLGVSGISADMRSLLQSGDAHAAEAVDLFVYRIACEIGALAAALGGLDALVFTAGIGEHAPAIRARVSRACAWLGATLDSEANDRGARLIHGSASRVQIAVVPTDEEKMIAMHTLALCGPA